MFGFIVVLSILKLVLNNFSIFYVVNYKKIIPVNYQNIIYVISTVGECL